MTLELTSILPNIGLTLDGTGFIFGAGTSYEAGYPMTDTLTQQVVGALKSGEREVLDEALGAAGEAYDDALARPNIEQISDTVIAHWINSQDPQYSKLETRLRELIVEQILAVKSPILDNHCRFFEALKKRAFGLPCTVWILTTNYDLLFETAGARVGVVVENGFSGGTERFFDPGQFRAVVGSVNGRRFSPSNQLVVKLVKLHGSISWIEEQSKFYERHPAALVGNLSRVMILPRRRKIIDALTPPFDVLFAQASRVLGSECKYFVSCGFSFADEHINQQLLVPAIQANRCRLFAFNREEPLGVAAFKTYPSFGAAYSTHLISAGNSVSGSTGLWQFSNFVKLFE